jgi:3-oxoacyl-[acyl-carrier-protein] synthase-3
MLYKNVCLEAYGYELPDTVVSSEDIEKRLSSVYERLKLPNGRLELISGIKERRFWTNGMRPSQVSTMAAQKAIQDSGISKKDIGCLIHSSVCRDFLEPATASVVHHALELPSDSTVFDVTNACLGFANSMVILANMIELDQIKAGLVVAGENGKQLVESTISELQTNTDLTRKQFKPYFASLTIGAGAVAVILTHSSISKTGHRLLGGQVQASTEHNDLCTGGGKVAHDGHVIMQTDSEAVLNHGIELAQKTWGDFKNELRWENKSPDRIFCHQVGSAHRRMLYDALELDLAKDFPTLEYLGNVGSASLPITMAIGIEKGLVKKNDKVAMLGIGSGLNCVMLGVEW